MNGTMNRVRDCDPGRDDGDGPRRDQGVQGADVQHRDLVELFDRVRVGLAQCASRDDIAALLAELERNADRHFADEEAHMEALCYPQRQAHRANHVGFALRLRDASRRHLAGEPIGLTTLGMLRAWLIEHMQRADRDYARFLQGGADSRITPAGSAEPVPLPRAAGGIR